MNASSNVKIPHVHLFQVSSFFGDTLFSTLLAILLSLSVELPLIRLFRYLTMRVGSK
jgi:hypothetical protein